MTPNIVQFGDVVEIVSGQVDPRQAPYRDMIHIGGDNIESTTGRLTGLRKASDCGLISGKYEFRTGDILYSKIRPALNKVVVPNFDGLCSADIYPLRPNPKRVDTSFLVHALRQPAFLSYAASHSTRTNIPKINREALTAYPLWLPPLSEQRRIADILDKADAIRRKRQEAIALTDDLLRSVFLEMFGDPVSNPKGWPSKPLVALARFVGGGTPSRQNASYFTGDICWATPKDMRGEVLTDTEEHITELALQGSSAKTVPPDTLLVVVKSKVLAHRLPVARTVVRMCFGQDLKGICLNDPSLVRYVHRHMLIGQSALLERARGLNTEGLTLEHLHSYEVMLPPSVLIASFTEIERRLGKISQRERTGLTEATSLYDSLVHRAFSGEL